MATPGKELLGEHYVRDDLTYEEIEELSLQVVTQAGEIVPEDELRGKVFTGQSTTLCYLQAS